MFIKKCTSVGLCSTQTGCSHVTTININDLKKPYTTLHPTPSGGLPWTH